MFPILQSPHDVALIFRKCQLHTTWEFLLENGGSELTDRADNAQENTKQEGLLILYPRQAVQAHPHEVSKVAKSPPVQVSKTTVKPPKSLFSHSVLGTASHHLKSFRAPAASLAASAPAPSMAAPVLEPGRHCFLLQGGLWYSGQV